MIEFIFIIIISSISLVTVYLTLDEDMLLFWFAKLVNKKIKNKFIRKPISECITCMASTWGSGLYWLLCHVRNYDQAFEMWFFAVLCIAFLSTYLSNIIYGNME